MKSKLTNKFDNLPNLNDCTIAIIGLGYVGLPLAIEFAKKKECLLSGNYLNRNIIGFDINEQRLEEIKEGIKKDRILSKEDALLMKQFFQKIIDEIK